MTEAYWRAIDLMTGTGLTTHQVDNARAVLALRAFPVGSADRANVLALILRKRALHRAWLFDTQRRWQRDRRTVSPRSCAIRKARWGNKHSDEAILRAEQEAVATRENYVRCNV